MLNLPKLIGHRGVRDLSPENTETWDSFNALVMVTELEEVFKISFSIEEVEGVTCVADIKKCLKNYNISF